MITAEDCIAMCGLTEAEVLAIAEHEHVPEVAAAALAEYLLERDDHGAEKIRDMIINDIRRALGRDDHARAEELRATLRRFLEGHPEAGTGADVP